VKNSAAVASNSGLNKISQIEETKSEGFKEDDIEGDEEELKQMSKSTVWTQNIHTISQSQ